MMIQQKSCPDCGKVSSAKTWRLVVWSSLLLAVSGASATTLRGNILVSRASGINEYTTSGALVQSIPFPVSPGDVYARDLVVSGDGRLQLFNGTFNPYLCTFNPGAGVWNFRTLPGWSTVNQVSWGGIAAFRDYVFVTDMATFNKEEQGIIRFDLANGTAQRFASDSSFLDVTVGQNGFLYGAGGGGEIRVFDPVTLQLIRTIQPNAPYVNIAIDAAGDIFTSDGSFRTVSHFSRDGLLLESLYIGSWLTDIDISTDGQLLIGSWQGGVYMTDVSLDSFTTLPVGGAQFVAFATPVPEPKGLLPGLAVMALLFGRIAARMRR